LIISHFFSKFGQNNIIVVDSYNLIYILTYCRTYNCALEFFFVCGQSFHRACGSSTRLRSALYVSAAPTDSSQTWLCRRLHRLTSASNCISNLTILSASHNVSTDIFFSVALRRTSWTSYTS